MAGRYAVSFNDVRAIARSALRHRIHRSFEAEAAGLSNDEIARRVVMSTPTYERGDGASAAGAAAPREGGAR